MNEAIQLARRVAQRVLARKGVWGSYKLDLALEAMLELDIVTGRREYTDAVLSVATQRGWPDEPPRYTGQPFCHLNYKLFEVTGDEAYARPFADETARYRREVTRSAEGAIAHYPEHPGRHLLIDMLQDYASRMAHAGAITGDKSYFDECVEQYRIYRGLVRDEQTGLWGQGRGWLDDPMELSPGAWSRGQGWVIRGMVDSLCALPRGSAQASEMTGYLRELATALLAVQDDGGMWRQLPHLPPDESFGDSTGTGLICYGFAKALHEGFLDDPSCRTAARQAFDALKGCVTPEGVITDACPGPGPLTSIDKYVRTPGHTEDGQGHGPFCILFACAGRVLLDVA